MGTPIHEALRLEADLRRAGIEPFAWIVNQSLLASNSEDPLLASKASQESGFIDEVLQSHSARVLIVPWQMIDPVGEAGLRRLFAR